MGIYGIVFKTQGGIEQGKNNQQQLGPQHNTKWKYNDTNTSWRNNQTKMDKPNNNYINAKQLLGGGNNITGSLSTLYTWGYATV